ncbi:SDR family oxidoreductase [Fontimonas sp. SYSU GA230001]|uniref:SDR family oxidoreductase n=1 Tax=Fontimonas sp. SYSU GA230001 TaxID=3142450 RepID=UPI0032B5AB71
MSALRRPATVVITGCSGGIGRALAREFHARGCTVYATARRPETLSDLAAQGLRTAALDVCDDTSIRAFAQQLRADGAGIDVLVNNAGYGQMGPLFDLDSAALRAQFETNVIGPIALTRALLPLMLPQRAGRIVNVGSVSGILVTPFAGAYCASKAAVHALSDALRMELAPFGIEVLVVQPGAIQSDFGAAASQRVARAPDSLYAAAGDGIAARANASQQHATPTAEFARRMVDAVLADRVAPVIRLGNGSTLLPWLARWLPTRLRDRLLSRRFRLDRLRP